MTDKTVEEKAKAWVLDHFPGDAYGAYIAGALEERKRSEKLVEALKELSELTHVTYGDTGAEPTVVPIRVRNIARRALAEYRELKSE